VPSHPPRTTSLGLLSRCIPFILAGSFVQPVNAENLSTEEWNISADKLTRFEDPSSIVAEGNVVLEKKERVQENAKKKAEVTAWSELLEEGPQDEVVTADEVEEAGGPELKTTVAIHADWIAYDVQMQTIKAKGNVRIESSGDEVQASEGTVNLTTETGKFTDAVVLRKEKSMHLEGKTIEKTGVDTYTIKDGWVVTCKVEEGETPPWKFAASNTDVTQGGYAILKNAKFKIKDVPVLYSPYMIVPVKDTRQTGFLFPEFSSSSNNGFGFNLPLFVNLSDSADFTFYPEYFTDRGFMPGAEFRYAVGENDKGMFSASYLDDQLSDPSETEYYEDTGYKHDNSDRYWIRGKADHDFGEWQSRLDIDVVSDQDYLSEFNNGVTGFDSSQAQYLEAFGRGFENDTDYERQNSLKILRSWSGMSLTTTFLAINDAYTEADDDEDTVATVTSDTTDTETTTTIEETPLWKLPSVAFTGTLPVADSSVNFDWDANYVNYWREEGIGGQRVDLRPAISTPIPLGQYLESTAEFALRDTFYIVDSYGDAEWDYDDTQNRLLPEFETEVATTLQRDYFLGEATNRTFDHQIRPYIKYDWIPDVDQDELPQFDSVDEIDEVNAITYGVDNFFNVFSTNKLGSEKQRQYSYLKLWQSYDLRDEGSDEPWLPFYAKLGWTPASGTSVSYKTAYDVYDSDFVAHTFEGVYSDSRGDYLAVDYSFKESSDIEQINAELKANLTNGWYLGGYVEHSIAEDETVKAKGSLTYQALCWSVKFETIYKPADTAFLLVFKLANIGTSFGIDM